MSVKPCSRHHAKIVGKLATFYWAWFNADGARRAYKESICMPCTREELSLLLANSTHNTIDVSACPACGTDSSADLDPIFLTLYAPQLEPKEFQLATCSACAARIRVRILEGGEPLPDRGVSVGGPRPSTSDAWLEALG